MTYTVGTIHETSANSVAQSSIDAPNFTATAGDTLIAILQWGTPSTATATLNDSVGTNDTWTECGSGVIDGTAQLQMRAFRLDNAAAGSCTVHAVFGHTVDFPAIIIIPVSGLANPSFDKSAFAVQNSPGTGTDALTGGSTGTLAAQPAMILGLSSDFNNTTTPAAGTGFTSIGTGWTYGGTAGMRVEHKRVTSTSSVSATFTAGTGTDPHASVTLAFDESGAGGGATPKGNITMAAGVF